MLGEVTVDVDETQARLTLIEAQQNRLEAENADLKDKNANLTQHVDRLSQENTNQANQLSQYHLENVNLTNNVQNLEAELTHFHETASKRVVWLKAYSTSYYWSDATVFSGFLLNADE
nr:hypothetical protein BaRGS_021141 [Batillaria attramentaria]